MEFEENYWQTCPDCGFRGTGHTCEPLGGQRGLNASPITYGLCLACGSVEVALNRVTGTRDLSNIGESDTYPIGYGCEVCA